MKKITFLLSMLLTLIFSISCENEEDLKILNIVEEETFELASLNVLNKNRALGLKVNWDSVLEVEREELLFREYSISNYSKEHYKLIGVTEKGAPTKFYVLLLISTTDYDRNMSYLNNLKGFSGTINWLDLNGEIVALEAFEKGKRINLTKAEDAEKNNALSLRVGNCGPGTAWKSDLNGKENLVSKDDCNHGYYVTTIYETWTNWYYDRGSLGWEYAYRSDEKKTYARQWVSTGRDYANIQIYGGSTIRYGNASSRRTVQDVATIEKMLADNTPPPSCKSFEFKNTSSNWQEASVINIRFNILVIEIRGGVRVKKRHTILFPQPVKFGMPRKFANGTTIPPGLAAELGARAINHAIHDVVSKYNNLVLNSTSVIRSDFQTKLKNEFREMANGGRVNFNDMSSVTRARQYKTYGLISDNCY